MGKFSLAEASVNWKFVTVALDILGLFLSPSNFHMCADRNFFLSKPTMHEIYSSRLKFKCHFLALSCNKFHSGRNTCTVGENFFLNLAVHKIP